VPSSADLSQKHAKPSDGGFAVSQARIDWKVLPIPKNYSGTKPLGKPM
jgi:hypothetical protein